MKITTNNIAREFLDFTQLTTKEQKEAIGDYGEERAHDERYIRYHGIVYGLADFERLQGHDGWDGCYCRTAFSGVLISLYDEGCIMGSYTS